MEFTTEQIGKAKACKTLDEFKALAKTEGLELSDKEAEKYFKETRIGELSDEDISAVSGGGKGKKNPKYKVGDILKDIRKPMGKGEGYFDTGVAIRVFFTEGEWRYELKRDKYTRIIPEEYLVRVNSLDD